MPQTGYIANPDPTGVVNQLTAETYMGNLNEVLMKDHIKSKLYDRYNQGGKGKLIDFLTRQGASKIIVPRVEYKHAEEPFLKEVATVAAISGSGAGAAVDVTLSAADHANGESWFQMTDTITVGGVRANVLAKDTGDASTSEGAVAGSLGGIVTAHVLQIAPADNAIDLSLFAGVGAKIAYVSNAQEEGSGKRKGRIRDVLEYQNQVQIIRTDYEVTGTALEGVTGWVDAPSVSGHSRSWVETSVLDNYHIHECALEGAFMFGESNNNTGQLGTTLRMTNGLEAEVKSGGHVEDYTAGSFALQNFENIVKYMSQNGGSNEYLVGLGVDGFAEIQNSIINLLNQGAVVYNAFKGSKEVATAMNFKSLSYLGMTFHFFRFGAFDDPTGMGVDTNYVGDGIMIPVGTTNIYKDQNQEKHFMLELCHLKDRYMRKSITGLGNGVATGTDDLVTFTTLSEAGIWPKCLNKFAWINRL